MSNRWTLLASALLAIGVNGLPSPRSCLGRYPLAEHSIDLYRTAQLVLGKFAGDITVGSQTVGAVFDTGSSNTWFMQPDTLCLDTDTHEPVPESQCGFDGPRLIPGSTFQPIPDRHMNASYISGELVIAQPGYDQVSFAGVEVPKQVINLAENISISLAHNTTGLVGLAFRLETDTYPGDDPSKDVPCGFGIGVNTTGCNEKHYSPLTSTIFNSGLTPPVFAFALSRDIQNAGIFTLGGLPDVHDPHVNITTPSVEATVAMEKLKDTIGYSFYIISIDGLHYDGASPGAGNKEQYIVDTGTVQTIISTEEADRINALFDPPARYSSEVGLYIVDCDATAPEYGIGIGGQTFIINPEDLILTGLRQAVTGGLGPQVCTSAIVNGTVNAESPAVLGSTFLKNVLAVFDVGEKEMTFASRMYYEE